MVRMWAESGLIAPVTFGNELIRFVILIGLQLPTILFFMSIDVKNRIAEHAIRISRNLKLHHHWQQTFGNAQNDQIDPTRLS
jgi:hypothetical protein